MSCCRCCGGGGICPKHSWRLPGEMPSLVRDHESQGGRYIRLQDGTSVFVRDQQPPSRRPVRGGNDNEDNDAVMTATTVVMIHGVPASSFLYRKFFDPLVQRGYRAIAMDLPGLGLSDKPRDGNYSWPALAESLAEILNHDDLDLFGNNSNNPNPPPSQNKKKIHLVIHDIGGPIAALYAAKHPEQVSSITVLDTLLDIESFSPPFPMWFFPIPIIGRIAITTLTPWIQRRFMHLRGVADPKACCHDEAVAWVWLLKHKGGSVSFSKIMKSFPKTKQDKTMLTERIQQGLGKGAGAVTIPMQIVWAQGEVAIPQSQCQYVQDNFDVQEVHQVPGRHFYQLESAVSIVDKIHHFLQEQQETPQQCPSAQQKLSPQQQQQHPDQREKNRTYM